MNGKAFTREIINEFHGITISNGTKTFFVKKDGIPDTNNVVVDFGNGVIYFDEQYNNKQFTATYHGEGVYFINAKRVATTIDGDGSVAETLDNKIESVDTKMNEFQTAENNRVSAEASRVVAEATRTSNEATRISNEAVRQANETARQNSIANLLNNMQIIWKGSVSTYSALPTSNRSVGDTWSVTNDGTPSNNGFWRWNGSQWVKITSLNPSGTETIANVALIDQAKAALVRDQVYSGVTSISTLTTGLTSPLNSFTINAFTAYVNGYRVDVPTTTVTLNPVPTFSQRDDLVFLEAWFPSTGSGYQLSYRIRVVDGVDFATYPEGINHTTKVKAWGGGSSDTTYTFAKDNVDVGLYKAGDGSSTAKTSLQTSDGYVYAIPLFRVKRRNNAGYRADNLNGARDYYVTKRGTGKSYPNGLQPGATDTIPLDASTYSLAKVGDVLSWGTVKIQIMSKDENNTVTIKNVGTVITLIGSDWGLVSDRPDGKYANIIDKDDIIDLRHQVSLTGFNYQKLLEENFDKLLRGELQTKDKPVMKKERFNLVPAPQGLKQELVPVTVVGNDGVARDLKNEIGKMIDLGAFKVYYGSVTAKYVENNTAIEVTSSYNFTKYYRTFIPKPNAYYLFVTESHMVSDSGNYTMYARKNDFYNSNIIASSPPLSHTSYAYKYIKFQAPSDAEVINVHLETNENNPTYRFRGFAVYEIDQNTYNLIDVDPEFTGDKLSQKFPCVDSYPNFVENLLPNVDGWEFGNIDITKGFLSPFKNIRTKNYVPVIEGKTLYFSTKSSAHRITVYFYDSNNNYINYVSGNANELNSTTVPANAKYAKFVVWKGDGTQLTESEVFSVFNTAKPMATYHCLDVYVPSGRWFLPHDYASGQVPTNFTRINDHRGVVSDAQISVVKTDIVEALKTPQSHIKVTQATEGQWTAGDTIQITSQEGVITGVLDADTALARALDGNAVNPTTIKVDDVSKLSVNDKIRIVYLPDGSYTAEKTITAVDTVNNTITIDSPTGWNTVNSDHVIVETTASTSVPTVTATGIAGTWSGLGTKQATFTITTPPTNNTDPIKIDYSISYPAGQGISEVPVEVYVASVNGERLVKASGNIVRVKANFEGKVKNSTDLIPHIVKRTGGTSLVNPLLAGELSDGYQQTIYNIISKLDGNSAGHTPDVSNGVMSQVIFSFDLIRLMEDKFSEQFFADCVTTADKVNKLKSVITKITCNWWGYGISPTGNKATIQTWNVAGSVWTNYNTTNVHTSSSVTQAFFAILPGSIHNYIDSNGFVHFIVYAEPSDGTKPSTIYTDYVELEVEINVAETGYDVLVPENPFPVMNENLLTANQAFPVEPYVSYKADMRITSITCPELGVIEITANGTGTDQYIGFEQNNIVGDEYYTWSFEARAVSTPTLTIFPRIVFWDGSTPTDCCGTEVTINSNSWTKVTFTEKASPNHKTIEPRINIKDNIAGTIQVRNLKVNRGTVATSWTPGRKKKTVLNFLGKVAGSTLENKNKLYNKFDTTFGAPSTFANEQSQTAYDNIGKQDGVLNTLTTNGTGQYAQELYEFDLSVLGLSLSELKKALRKLTVTWVGYGKGDNAGVVGYGVKAKMWDGGVPSPQWWEILSSTSSTPTTLVTGAIANQSNFIDKNQKVYILVHTTYPAGTGSASELYTDYVKLEIELADYVDYVKSNVVKVRKETKEVKLQYPAKSYRSGILDTVELWYKYVPYQGLVPSDVGYATVNGRMLTHLMLAVTSEGTGYPKKSLLYEDGKSPIYSNKSSPVSRFLPLRDPKYLYDLCYHDIRNGEQEPTTFRFLNKAKFQENGADDVNYPYNPYPTAGQKVSDFSKVSLLGKFYIHRECGVEGIYKGNIGKTDNYANFLAIGYGLFEYNGELYIGVLTTMNYGSKDIWIDSHWLATLSAADFYKIDGRPLVKGV